jgi:hypothetical protein
VIDYWTIEKAVLIAIWCFGFFSLSSGDIQWDVPTPSTTDINSFKAADS